MTVTVFTIAAGADDGHVEGAGVTASGYPPAYDSADPASDNFRTLSLLSGGSYYYDESLLRFDTSALGAGAVVSAATLTIYALSKVDTDSRSIQGEYHTWTPAMGAGNYTTTPGDTAFTAVTIASITTSAEHVFTLTNLGSINVTGYTGFRLSVTGAAPTGDNRVTWEGYDAAGTNHAHLDVTWTLPTGHRNRTLMGVG